LKLPKFFIDFLTEPDDLVLDFFAGSNTTGLAAEVSHRRWIAFEKENKYLAASTFRFLEKTVSKEYAEGLYKRLLPFQTTVYIETENIAIELEVVAPEEAVEVDSIGSLDADATLQPSLFEV
jgi:site-specific DNA-methyltransferase (cytosine-N4-specific)